MITVITYIILDKFKNYVDERTELLGLAIIEVCVVSILVYPFFHKKSWSGIKGYLEYLENLFF